MVNVNGELAYNTEPQNLSKPRSPLALPAFLK
jgi:hypothetical protein